jgi:hypothetical protein
MVKLTEIEIQNKHKDIENRIKARDNFTRTDIQEALDKIKGYGYSPDYKKEKLKEMILRTEVKDIGIRTIFEPRGNLKEEDKTFDFLNDIYSYIGVIER